MTDDDKALDKIIRASMPLDFERKETLSDDKALVKRLRDESIVGMPMENEAADRIEAQAAEIERLEKALVNAWNEQDPNEVKLIVLAAINKSIAARLGVEGQDD
jgi:hypothetical protein